MNIRKRIKNQRTKSHFGRGRAPKHIKRYVLGALVTKEMTIGEVIKKYPKTAFVFIDYGLHCVGCPMAFPETIEEATKVHQIELKKFLDDLNKVTK